MLADHQIAARCQPDHPNGPMIQPFNPEQVREVRDHNAILASPPSKVISYGLSSYGYDIRVGHKFRIFTDLFSAIVDPKAFDTKAYIETEVDKAILIPPNSFALAESIETFNIHRDLITICLGKSTYARCGVIVNVTPFEPEWRGTATIEISNMTPVPVMIYAGEGIAQVLFDRGDAVCATSYADRNGRYQDQRGITNPTVG